MLTKRQRDVLVFITNYQKREGGVSPSCDDIRVGLGLKSRGRIPLILRALEERGFIRRLAHRNRAIAVIRAAPGGKEPPRATTRIPIFDADTLQLRGYLP
jgi:repressor LexA